MTTAYTSLLGFALPVTGELSGTWGDTVNNGITSLLDSAIAGTTTLSADSDVTLTTTQGSSNTAREAILLWTAGGSATRTITAPAQSKIYTVINASSGTQSIILAGAGPTSGVTIAKGESALCAWNGSDFIKISNTAGPGTFTNLTVTGNTSLGDADTDTITQAASYVTGTQLKSAKTATNTLSLAAYDVDGTAYTNLITLTASNTPTLALTSTGVGTINNMSIGATTASTGAFTTLTASGNVTLGDASTDTLNVGNGDLVKDASGNLGIGTSSPGVKLDVSGAIRSTAATPILYLNNGTTQHSIANSSGAMPFTIDGTESMRLTSTSLYTASAINVGIGTSSPAYKLEVATGTEASGQVAVANFRTASTTASYNAGIQIYATASATAGSRAVSAIWDADGANSSGGDYFIATKNGNSGTIDFLQYSNASMRFGTNYTNRASIDMTLSASGNLAIGTTETGVGKVNVQLAGAVVSGNTTGAAVGASSIFQLNNANGGATNSTVMLLGGGTGTNAGQICSGIGFSRENENDWGTQLRFYTHQSTTDVLTSLNERMRIDSSGNLLVGTTSAIASERLNVTGSVATGFVSRVINQNATNPQGMLLYYSGASPNNSGAPFLYCLDTTTLRAEIRSNGGIANYSANNVNLSDRREKTNFTPAGDYLAKICAIPVQTFNYIDQNLEEDGGLTLGVVAQDVQAIAPELVMESNWGTVEEPKMRLSIYQTDLQYALMKALQELKAEFDAYKASHP